MVEVEKALRESVDLYKRNPVFVLPHLVESILSLVVLLSMAITIVLAIGVHVADIIFEDDPQLLLDQITGVGMGLIAIIILTFIFGLFLATLIKAGALAGVLGMARRGFNGEKVAFRDAIENAKTHTIDIFLFWILLTLIIMALFAFSVIPAAILSLLGASNMLAIAATILAFLIVLVLAAVVYVAVMFAPQFIVVSGAGIVDSIKMSLDFIKRNIGATLIYLAVIVVFNFFLFGFFGIISLLPNLFYESSQFLGASLEIFFFFMRLGVGLIIAPYFEIVKTRMIMEESDGVSVHGVDPKIGKIPV
jgi:hypothetical protein